MAAGFLEVVDVTPTQRHNMARVPYFREKVAVNREGALGERHKFCVPRACFLCEFRLQTVAIILSGLKEGGKKLNAQHIQMVRKGNILA